jgi:exonuclease III
MKIVTWNMDYWKRNSEQRELAWNFLLDTINPDIALIQEIVPPEISYKSHNVLYHEIDGKRKWGTLIISKYPIHREIYSNKCYPGANALIVAEIKVTDKFLLTAVNVYGQLDADGYATTTMHHILSDLTTILYNKGSRNIIFGGDFNVSEQFNEKYDCPSHKLVFDRIEDFGLINCTKKFYNKHIQTHVHSKSEFEWQNDYIFVSNNIIEQVTNCTVLNEKNILQLSDHYPVVIEFK